MALTYTSTDAPDGLGKGPFSGSYHSSDCLFLLTPMPARFTSIEEKERLIQRGRRHYSELISPEAPPDRSYLRLFHDLTRRYRQRLAQEVLALAAHIAKTRPPPLTIVSLARAGTPCGALLQRALTRHLDVASKHFSISIIRDRGIDTNALRYILRREKRRPAGLVFVDAWTAKGVITRELKRAIADWNRQEPEQLDDRLYVIADIGGSADVAATYDDYAIPSGVLNAVVSGLVSRSILNEQIGPGQFHGCILYDGLRGHDQTNWFLDEISGLMTNAPLGPLPSQQRAERRRMTAICVERWQEVYQIAELNHIKPGVAEATRVMLRRVPARLLLRDSTLPDVAHLRWLARQKGIPISLDPYMPFNAAAFIRTID